MSRPTVSIVILNYNGMRFLKDCIESLERQNYPRDRFEIVMADNASTDDSVAYVQKKYPAVNVITLRENLGFATGNNRAIEQVQSDYILTINNDTISYPDLLSLLMAECENGADCVGAHNISWDEKQTVFCGGNINFFGTGLAKEEPPKDMKPFEVRFVCGCGMLMQRKLFLESGGFDDDFFMYQEDVDLGWRLNILGYRVVMVPRAMIRHYEGGSTPLTPTLFHKSVSIRNPMLSMIKNYELSNLQKALPVTLLQSMNRVMFHMGVEGYDDDSLKVFEKKLDAGNPTDRDALIMTMANLAGLHGFLGLLHAMIPKREAIQAKRKVSDEEIFQKFNVELGYGSYLRESNYGVNLLRVLEYFDVATLLEPGCLDKEVLKYTNLLDQRIATLSSQLQRNQLELDAIHNSRGWRLLQNIFKITRRLGFK